MSAATETVKSENAGPRSLQGGSGSTRGQSTDPDEWLRTFERRTYVTFLSRARASAKLESRGMLWMIALSVASATALCASVSSLATAPRPVSQTDLAAALFTLATLVLSLIVSALNYQARARDLFHSYRAIQRVSTQAESLRRRAVVTPKDEEALSSLESAYQEALDKSENHTTLDYHRARPARTDENKKADERSRKIAIALQGILTFFPVAIILISLYWLVMIFLDLRG